MNFILEEAKIHNPPVSDYYLYVAIFVTLIFKNGTIHGFKGLNEQHQSGNTF